MLDIEYYIFELIFGFGIQVQREPLLMVDEFLKQDVKTLIVILYYTI